jgi:ubiquinone biosynthesis protein UbiJ
MTPPRRIFEMTSAPLEEMEFAPLTGHVPFEEMIDRLESHLRHQARMPNLDDRLRMAAAKAISEGRRTITGPADVAEEYDHCEDSTFYLIAAE